MKNIFHQLAANADQKNDPNQNSMLKVCSAKCIDKTYREGELSKGEAVCLDRCSAKFFEAHTAISEQLQKEGAARGFGTGM